MTLMQELTKDEENLLKLLKSTKCDSDGYFELEMSLNPIDPEYLQLLFFSNFKKDKNIYKQILKLYFKRSSYDSFRNQMRKVAKISMQNKLKEEQQVTCEFVVNIACAVDSDWLEKNAKGSKKLCVTYFLKNISIAVNLDKPRSVKRNILFEYLSLCNKPSIYILNLLLLSDASYEMDYDEEIKTTKELKRTLRDF